MTTARVLAGDAVVDLDGADIEIVPSGPAVVIVDDPNGLPIRLDGRLAGFKRAGTERLFAIDLTRSTGFHRLQVGAVAEFWFGTEDAKLGLDGVTAMLEWLRTDCQSWTGQLLFSDGTGYLDPYVAYGWLDRHADGALAAIGAVARAPRHGTTTARAVTDQGGRRLDMRATLALLRGRQSELLVPASSGITLGSETFMPRKAVVRVQQRDLDTPPNRRVAWLTLLIARLCAYVISTGPDGVTAGRVQTWANEAKRVLARTFVAQLVAATRAGPPGLAASTEELTDARYAKVLDICRSAVAFGDWHPSSESLPIHAYVQQADRVYQAFVASAVAEALSLAPAAARLGAVQPAFASGSLRLFVDSDPPREVMRSWRSYTPSPDDYRPDILLQEVATGRVVLGDAKYRQGPAGSPESGRKDIQAYMNAFGLGTAVMFYPPPKNAALDVTQITAEGQTLHEVAVAPSPDLIPFLKSKVVPVLSGAMATPPWRD